MSNKKIVIGIAGNIGAGKGTVSEYLSREYQAVSVIYTNILKDILDRLHLKNERKNLATLAEGLRNTFGADILSVVLAGDLKEKDAHIIVFDGIRKKAELEYFKNEVENFIFIFVDVSIETAYERLVKRGEKTDDTSKTLEEFKKDHKRPADRDVPLLISEADYVIDNSGSMEDAYLQVAKIMNSLQGTTSSSLE